jgi:hypothetical protein
MLWDIVRELQNAKARQKITRGIQTKLTEITGIKSIDMQVVMPHHC